MGARRMFGGIACGFAISMAALMVFLLAVPASAQEAGTILGVVRDASGGTVPNAKITITNMDTAEARSVNTGGDGAYRVPALRPGNYAIKVEAAGFRTSNTTGLVLTVAQELVTNVVLQVGAAAQEITVTGEAPVVNTTTSTLGALVDEQRVADLPLNGRNYEDLTLIQPGIQINTSPSGGGSGSSGTWFSSNGLPPRSNTFMVDGALAGNQYGTGPNSISGSTLGVDGIKEYRIITNMFGPEYGMTMGSQMVIVSKGGTNNWHGDVFEYLRNNHLDARNFFEAQPALLNGQRTPPFQRNNFGASGGGPIQKDKTFFYLVYEGLRMAQQDSIQTTTLPAACHFLTDGTNNIIVGGGNVPSGVTPNGFTNQQILKTRLTGGPWYVAPSPQTGGCGSMVPFGPVNQTPVNLMVTPWIGQFPFPNEGANLNQTGAPNFTFPGKAHIREDYSQLRVDHNFSASDTLFARYTFDDNRLTDPYPSLTRRTVESPIPNFSPLA